MSFLSRPTSKPRQGGEKHHKAPRKAVTRENGDTRGGGEQSHVEEEKEEIVIKIEIET